MSWKKKVFENFRLYAVTDLRNEDPEIFRKVESVCRGGADIVQLRSKTLPDAALYRIALRMKIIAHRYRTLFFINDRLDLALAVEADGLHLGQDDLPAEGLRRVLKGKSLFVGRSTHSLQQALKTAREGVDYIGVGPIFKTPTKPDYPSVGTGLIRKVKARIRIPFVCIGGISSSNVNQVVEAGGERVAVVRAVFDSSDPERSARELKMKIMKARP